VVASIAGTAVAGGLIYYVATVPDHRGMEMV